MKTIHIFPNNDHSIGWRGLNDKRRLASTLQQEITVDFLVIGAGLAGLAAARRLAENRPDACIALVDAERVGEGTHARNSGFAIDVPHNTSSMLLDQAHAQRHLRLARAAIDFLEQQVKAYGINCEWEQAGKFHAAVSPQGVETILRPTQKLLDVLHEPYEWLDRSTLEKKVGFNHFHAAIYTPGTVLLNPRALTQGLVDNLPANVDVYENSPITSITYGTAQTKAQTPAGSVMAHQVVIAVNAFAEQFGVLKNRLIPIAAHASLTRPLTEPEQQALQGLKTWGITPANAFVGITMRRTPDQRILIRQNMAYAPDLHSDGQHKATVAQQHQRLFSERFPMLPNVTIQHTWKGIMCVSANMAPGFGELMPNVFSAVCHNGIGLTSGTISGMLAADLMTQRDNPLLEDIAALGLPTQLPPRPLLDMGVRSKLAWEAWQYRAEL
ncbi:NAD(P)/FAD-dependent oxidoreductase [Paenalcaligenes hominis]|uniref:NAD(P)/FAD-dependent oxidoreductase n=1 Tax=Paenalcaligenes hominis TaxID=643674 RepID=UPI0035256640